MPLCNCPTCQRSRDSYEYRYGDEERYTTDEGSTAVPYSDNTYPGDYPEIMNYSYSPPLRFYRNDDETDARAFYGLEVEISDDGPGRRPAIEALGHPDGLGWLKSDASVDGFEMVTMPMTYAWAMDNFPWDMFGRIQRAGAWIERTSNGIHCHVSRAAFDNSSHVFRWMKMVYANQAAAEIVARRQSSRWAAFSGRHFMLNHAKRNKAGKLDRDNYALQEIDQMPSARYRAINTQNDATFEVRIFAASLDPGEVKACLQFVAATVEYTRTLTASQVAKHGGWTWPVFHAWLQSSGKYPDLATMTDPSSVLGLMDATTPGRAYSPAEERQWKQQASGDGYDHGTNGWQHYRNRALQERGAY